jgi:hypothetical protein
VRNISILALAALFLSACSTGPLSAPNYANIVGMIQTDWPIAAAALPQSPTTAAITSLVNGLSATSAPTSIAVAVKDVAALVPSIPTCAAGAPQNGCLSTQTKTDITLGLSLLSGGLSISSMF